MTTPAHPEIENLVIFENATTDTGYVITHIAKSNRRPFQVINEGDFRYYIRAGSNSLPASDTFIRSLFGQDPQPDVFLTWGVAPIEILPNETIKIQAGLILHNAGENVARNINGYAQIFGLDLGIEINQNVINSFSYSTNSLSGMKVSFMAKDEFKLGVEQEVLPLTLQLNITNPVQEYGIRIKALVTCDNQMSYRIDRTIEPEQLQALYNSYIANNDFDILGGILNKEGDVEEVISSEQVE